VSRVIEKLIGIIVIGLQNDGLTGKFNAGEASFFKGS
jgi:hypothetical protein